LNLIFNAILHGGNKLWSTGLLLLDMTSMN